MDNFTQELTNGFAELEGETGTTLVCADGSEIRGVISAPSESQLQIDLSQGHSYMVRIEIARTELPAPWPKVGHTLVEKSTGTKYVIADRQFHDVTDPTVIFVCRTTGTP